MSSCKNDKDCVETALGEAFTNPNQLIRNSSSVFNTTQ